ncbi:hypothetical protein [Brasilonema sp. UFV-L1]|uniref:hypothetical protein n=1 Tax=Brasilonema sp. UFV-L1 TaxID=2234130 RepID=UPI001B7D01BB|nr:hypothetical protein [Brasilonema sp. UFV-L1]
MSIANRATSLAVTVDDSKKVTSRLWKPLQLGSTVLVRLWWYSKAYGTVLMIGLITVLSLIFLRIYWAYRKLLLVSTHEGIEEEKWHTLTGKPVDISENS